MHRIFEISIEIFGWIQIVLSPNTIPISVGESTIWIQPQISILISNILCIN